MSTGLNPPLLKTLTKFPQMNGRGRFFPLRPQRLRAPTNARSDPDAALFRHADAALFRGSTAATKHPANAASDAPGDATPTDGPRRTNAAAPQTVLSGRRVTAGRVPSGLLSRGVTASGESTGRVPAGNRTASRRRGDRCHTSWVPAVQSSQSDRTTQSFATTTPVAFAPAAPAPRSRRTTQSCSTGGTGVPFSSSGRTMGLSPASLPASVSGRSVSAPSAASVGRHARIQLPTTHPPPRFPAHPRGIAQRSLGLFGRLLPRRGLSAVAVPSRPRSAGVSQGPSQGSSRWEFTGGSLHPAPARARTPQPAATSALCPGARAIPRTRGVAGLGGAAVFLELLSGTG